MFQRQSFCDLSCTYYLQFPTLPCPHANASITAEEKRVLFPLAIHTPERQSRRVWWGCLRESGQCLSETRVSCVPCPHSLVRCLGMDMASDQASEAVRFGTFQPLTLNFNLPAPASSAGVTGGHHHI